MQERQDRAGNGRVFLVSTPRSSPEPPPMPIQRSKMIQLVARETSGCPTKVGFYLDDTTHRQRDLELPHAGGDLPPVLFDHTEPRSRLPHAGGSIPIPKPYLETAKAYPTPVGIYPYRQGKVSRYRSLPHTDGQSPNQPEILLQTPYHPTSIPEDPTRNPERTTPQEIAPGHAPVE